MCKSEQQIVVDNTIRSIAEEMMKLKGTKGHTNETYEEGIQEIEQMLRTLCEMYKISY